MTLRVESVQFDELSADPTSPVDGQAWYNTTTDQLKARISGTTRKIAPPPELYDAIVAPSGGDYTSVYDAFNAGHTTVYVRSGTYIETNTIVIPDGGQLIGEDGALINFNGGSYRVECDGNGGTQETTGTIAATQDSAAVVGTGTTFTNLSVGDQIEIGSSYFEIATITDNTNLTIIKPWRGPATSGLPMLGQTMYRNVRIANIRILNSAIQGLFVRAILGLKLDSVNVFNCTGNNIEMRNNYGANVEHCISKNSLANGFYLNGCHEAGFDGYCHGDNNDGKGIHIDGNCDDVKVSSSSFTSNGGDGVSVNGTSHNCSILGCVASYNGGKGFDTTSGTSATCIVSCVVEHNAGYGIDWDGSDNSISSCIVSDNGGGLQGGDGGTIVGNHVESNNGIGINLADGDDDNSVTGNHIVNNTGDGIRIDCDDCLFVGNVVSTNGGDGISILAGANNNRFSNNITSGNTSTDFDDGGTNTYVLDGDVSAAAAIDDNALVRGDGGAKGVQGSAWDLADSGDLQGNNNDITEVATVRFNSEYDNGNSGTADTINWNNGQKQKSTLTANCTYTFTAPASGVGNFLLRIVQNATGGWEVTWPASVKWQGGSAPELSEDANAIDIVSFYYDGTNYYGVASLDFS